ncbi:nitroreductase [Mucilaginibacter aquariorum]|uniref:Nitroreductase n=1 Tax=Mucilaginibacter aquariorum TaxID=2967225 RepID=A0ABT1TAG4_9SPHI|nr:nitroreductase [Mucilaginibacter aquariorum]MCQ6961585.1 nitroreductase [Mucilaginibacter aquariorum]
MKTIKTSEELPETLRTIYERRSVRRYKDLPVEREILSRIIDAGRMAPTAMMKQPWHFYVLTEKESIEEFSKAIIKTLAKEMVHEGPAGIVKLAAGALYSLYHSELLKGPDIFYHAPVVVFLTAPKDEPWACYDISMCAQNMMLAAKALGLDSCPLGVGKAVEHTPIYYKLRIPYPEQVYLALVFGYGDEAPKAHERLTANVHFIDDPETNTKS